MYQSRTEPVVIEHVARAMYNKGLALSEQQKTDEAIAAYDDLIEMCRGSMEPAIVKQVSDAMLNKGAALLGQGSVDAAIAVYDDLIETYKRCANPTVAQQVAKTMFNKGLVLSQKGDNDAAIAVYDDLLKKYDEEPAAIEPVTMAMLNKGAALAQKGNAETVIAVYDDLIKRYSAEPAVVEQVVKAMFNKGVALGRDNDVDAQFKIHGNIITLYRNSTDPAVLEVIARAMRQNGDISGAIGLLEKTKYQFKDSYDDSSFWAEIDELIRKFRKSMEQQPVLIEQKDDAKSGKEKTPSLSEQYQKLFSEKWELSLAGNIWSIMAKPDVEVDENDLLFLLNKVGKISGSLLWRGAAVDYPLRASFYHSENESDIEKHKNRLKTALRGLPHYREIIPNADATENHEFWMFAQHHGAKTPMLDWTVSPFVALFFAFEHKNDTVIDYRQKGKPKLLSEILDGVEHQRVLYVFNAERIDELAGIKLILPALLENPRAVAQSGILMMMEVATVLEDDAVRHLDQKQDSFVLLKIYIRDGLRHAILNYLNIMNINHRTLFPDHSGAVRYANMSLEIDGYDPIQPVMSREEEKPANILASV